MKRADEDKFLERLARYLRFRKGFKYIDRKCGFCILDLGSGQKVPFLTFLKKHKVKVRQYIAVDPRINTGLQGKNLKPQALQIEKKIELPDGCMDYVVGFAFLEHANHPGEILSESIRVLKKGGKIILTTPTPKSRILLELILTNLGLISKREISEHKKYFDKKSILQMLPEKDINLKIDQKYFELGLNNLCVITKY